MCGITEHCLCINESMSDCLLKYLLEDHIKYVTVFISADIVPETTCRPDSLQFPGMYGAWN